MALSWVIAGGGTGGHVTMALAIAEILDERGERVIFVGSSRGLESRLVPQAGFELVALESEQVVGRNLLGRIRGVLGILRETLRARAAIAKFGADAVISVGGYAAMPPVLAAIVGRRPIALIEPNAMPGRVNRISARFAKRIFCGFDATADLLKAGSRGRTFGIPLRRDIVAKFPESAERRKAEAPFRILVFGGSQGARQINEAMMDAAPQLATMSLEIFHSSGEADRDRVAEAYRDAGVSAEVVPFEPNLPTRYYWADLAITRSGALTIAELAMAGLPALLVPYPYAADDHQAANAEELERVGAARRLRGLEEVATRGQSVVDELRELLAAPERLGAMSRAAQGVARPRAASEIVDECMRMLQAPGGSR